MPMEVSQGGDDRNEALDRRQLGEYTLLKMGMATRYIPLNGGSQTRADIRDFWREWARDHNVAIKTYGHAVILGKIDNA